MNRVPSANAGASTKDQEAKQIRRLQMMISMVMSVISQDHNLTVEEASNWSLARNVPPWPCFPTKSLPTTFSTSPACNA